MDTAEILQKKISEINKLCFDIGMIISVDSWAGYFYQQGDISQMIKAIERGDF